MKSNHLLKCNQFNVESILGNLDEMKANSNDCNLMSSENVCNSNNRNEADLLKSSKKCSFKPPQEAPVFYPSVDEFQDSLSYITKIKPVAEKYGICKIVPPKGWQPPFSLNVDKLKFRPRIQKLNELDALSRLKLNFIDLLMKFWELQGLPISKPMIDSNKTLDLYTLWKLVQKEGGFEEVIKKNLWSSIAETMQYYNKNAATILKNTYKYVLHPYDIYISNNSKLDFKMPKSSNNERKYKSKKPITRRIFKDINEESNQKIENQSSKNNSLQINSESHDINSLKKAHISTASSKSSGLVSESNITKTKRESKNPKKVFNSVNSYNCIICNKDDKEELLMICVKCSANCHTFCSKPTYKEIPRGDWHCPTCLASEIRKVIPAYGFETCDREYNLQQFGEMADLFKCQYFRMQVHKVSNSMIEQEFWRILSDIDEKVAVEYGADLHSMDHGSGFPVYSPNNSTRGLDYYIDSSWNLNNIPILEGSVLGHINADISGMKIPWMYVGMCFSTFCWHNEDHWSYSINYLHWGEIKTWYGIPGDMAEAFEQAIRNIAPELFEAQADLLHQLVTIINPNLITAQNVPVYRLDQQAGEFVITFPRAYHAGFNQGYNFAEAVNFAPSDWIQKGRECITHYANLKRYCVFSHDELICKMALSINDLGYSILEVLLQDLMTMMECERNYRKKLLEYGVNSAERVYFELIPDNERMCNECKTTCFLSAIKCKCSLEKLCCLKHFNKVCTCSFTNFILCYRYTMDELPRMIAGIKHRLKDYQEWLRHAENALNPQQSNDNRCMKKNLTDFRQLVKDAKFWKDPKPEPLFALQKIIQISECCIDVIKQLELTKNLQEPKLPFDSKTSSISSLDSLPNNCNELTEHTFNSQKNTDIDLSEKKVSYNELISFIEEIDNLPCIIDEKSILNDLLKEVEDFRNTESELYNKNFDEINLTTVEELLLQSQKLCIRCIEIEEFYTKLKVHQWTQKINQLKNNPNSLKLDDYHELVLLKQKINDELLIKDTKAIQVIEKTIKVGQIWERKADKFLNTQKKRTFEQLVQLLEEAQNIQAVLKFEDILLQYYKMCDSWRIKIDKIYSLSYYPFCNIINEMYQKGLKLPVEFKELTFMKNSLKESEQWRCDLRKYFLRSTNSKFNIFDRLLPKTTYSAKYFFNNSTDESCILSADFAPVIDNVKFGDLTSGKDIEFVLKTRQKREYDYYRHIQTAHYQKFTFQKNSDNFCYCNRKLDGVMVMCNLCKEWFHSQCIEMPKKYIYRNLNEEVFSIVDKYLCSNCKRTQQPYLDDVVPLMEKLENLHIRLPESEVLHYLVDRAVAWRDKVKKFLREPEIVYWQSQNHTFIKQYINDMSECIRNPNIIRNHYQSIDDNSTINDYENNLHHFEIKFNYNLAIYIEKLIFLGDLMEFRTNETYKLWLIWQCTRNVTETPSIMSFNTIDNTFSKKIKRENNSKTVKNMLGRKKKLIQKIDNDQVNESTTSSSSGDDSCAAVDCIDPPDTKIDWVQCDGGCNQWFHLHCLGLKREDINEEEDFICSRCK